MDILLSKENETISESIVCYEYRYRLHFILMTVVLYIFLKIVSVRINTEDQTY